MVAPQVVDVVLRGLEKARVANTDLEEAYETYVAQYGSNKISISEPFNLAETVEPATLILGRNCTIFYNDNMQELKGSLGSLVLEQDEVYIIGRRQPQDSKLVVWYSKGQMELEIYNAGVGTILSRIHAGVACVGEKQILFTDLGSSSGSVIVGESKERGCFVRVYDPGTDSSPSVMFNRISTTRRIS